MLPIYSSSARLARNLRDPLMDTTVLVHECFLKFANAERLTPGDRGHFLSYAATMMRSIIVDAARATLTERRGGGAAHVTLDTEIGEALVAPEEEILDVHGALDQLARLDARLAKVVDMRYSGGTSDAEIAQVLGLTCVSPLLQGHLGDTARIRPTASERRVQSSVCR